MAPRFHTLHDWLEFCRQEPAPDASAEVSLDAEEIQQAVRALMTAINRHEDGQHLANLWLARYGGGRLRLVSVIGKRVR